MIAPAPNAIRRVLLTIEALQRFSGPVSAGSLALTLAEKTGNPTSKRTVLRDLQALAGCGYVEVSGGGRRGVTVLWQWKGNRLLKPTA